MNHHPYYDDLLRHLLTFMQMPDNFPDLFFPDLTDPITYTGDCLVFEPGDIANMAYWIPIGYMRTFREFKPEEDCERMTQVTDNISVPGKIFLLEDNFMCGATAKCFVEITKGSTVVGFSNSSFVELAKKMPEVTSLALNVISSSRSDNQKRTDICKMSGAEGYAAILEHFGEEIESFLYQKDIASYMGTSPVNLSRIRRDGGYGDEHLRKLNSY